MLTLLLIAAAVHTAAPPPKDLYPELKTGNGETAHDNRIADREGLVRYTDATAREAIKKGILVPLLESPGIEINRERFENDGHPRQFVLPRVRNHLIVIGRKFYSAHHTTSKINSALRTREAQKKERDTLRNPNAMGLYGLLGSTHMTGATIDIAIWNRPSEHVDWLRAEFVRLERAGCLNVMEENREKRPGVPTMLHVFFYRACHQPPASRESPVVKKEKAHQGKEEPWQQEKETSESLTRSPNLYTSEPPFFMVRLEKSALNNDMAKTRHGVSPLIPRSRPHKTAKRLAIKLAKKKG